MRFLNTSSFQLSTFSAIVILGLSLVSCKGTKFLAENEILYTGADINIENQGKIPSKKALTNELSELVRPKPNQSIFGMRPKLWIYMVTRDSTKDKGLKNWINNKLGEPPVLLKTAIPENSATLMTNSLYNKGYFQAEVAYQVNKKKKTAEVEYTASIKSPYRIRHIIFPNDSVAPDSIDSATPVEIRKKIQSIKDESLLQVGNQYKLDVLIEERERIDRALKNQGYYYFNPDYLLFQVDSTVGDRQVNVYLKVKPNIPNEAEQVFFMNNIYIDDDHQLVRDTANIRADTIMVNDYHYISNNDLFRPRIITESVFLRPDSIYSRKAHDQTLRRLMGLGAFNFVNVRFEEVGSNLLNASVQLTPMKKKSIEAELQAVSKSNGFAGPGLNISFRNRNTFGGAELLTIRGISGYETQISGRQSGLNTYELGLEAELLIPRFITPFNIRVSSNFVPKTKITLGYRLQNRVNYFRLNSFSFALGYIWKEDVKKQHEFNPININYLKVGNTSTVFDSLLSSSPVLARSFAQQFILGTTYSFTYNTKLEERRTNEFYFNGNIDISGNTMHLIQNGVNDEDATVEEPYTIFGTAYSQYTRVDTDFRYYHNFSSSSSIATRFIAGVGVPYGNSSTLPYIKQFFIGGTNSIRAFPARALGPGTYVTPDSVQRFLIDQVGDIRLEFNTEYRFDIYSVFKGALFFDAGNIWLIRDNPERPGGTFDTKTFLNQLAVGTGFGVRIDASFFVLRFDLAFPLRIPYPGEEERWVIDEIDIGSSTWRKNNLILNIAIGYPF